MKQQNRKNLSALFALVLAASLALSGCNHLANPREAAPDPPTSEAPEPSNDPLLTKNDAEIPAEADPTAQPQTKDETPEKPTAEPTAQPAAKPASKPASEAAKLPLPAKPSSLPSAEAPVAQPEQNPNLELPAPLPLTTTEQAPPPRPAAEAQRGYSNVSFRQPGLYSKSQVYQNGTIKQSGVTIKNKTFTGDLTIEPGVGKQEIVLDNVAVKGNLIVKGGTGWLKLYNCEIGAILSKNTDAKAKLFASQNTSVAGVTIAKSTTLEEGKLSGDGFRNVEVNGDKGLDLSLKNLSLNKLSTRTMANVIADSKTLINYFYANAPTELYGAGQTNRLFVRSNGVYYDTKPLDIQTSSGYAEPSRRGNTSDTNHNNTTKKTVRLYTIPDHYIQNNENRLVNVDSNGTSLRVTTSNAAVAKVSYTNSYIRLQGKKQGTSTITVTASRSGYTSTSTTFQVIVADGGTQKIQLSSISDRYLNSGDIRYVDVNTTADRITVTNSSRDVAAVYVDGFQLQIVAKNRGTSTVTVEASRSGYPPKSTTFQIIVDKPSSGTDEDTSQPDVRLYRIDDQFLGRGVDKVLNVNTNASTIQATSSDERVVRAVSDGLTLRLIPQATPGRAVVTVTASRSGYDTRSTDFYVTVSDHTISPPLVSARTQDGFAYLESSWTNQSVIFSLDYTASRDLYTSSRPAGTGSESWIPSTYLSGNTYKLDTESNRDHYFFTKGSGGNSEASKVFTVRIDKTKPLFSGETLSANTASFTLTDALSGMSTVTVNHQGTITPGINNRYTLTAKTPGDYTVTATDKAGNSETRLYQITNPSIDTQIPVISAPTIAPPIPAGGWSNTAVTVSFSVTDNKTVQSVTVKNGTESLNVSKGSTSSYSFIASKNGYYTIDATDDSGNQAVQQKLSLAIDSIPPLVASLTSDPVQPDNTAKISIAATDQGGSGISSYLVTSSDSTESSLVVDDKQSFLGKAGNSYTITVTDKAGNSSTPKTVTIYPPVTPPTPPTPAGTSIQDIAPVVISDSNNWKNTNKTVSFTVNASLAAGDRLNVSVTAGPGRDSIVPQAGISGNLYTFTAEQGVDYTIKAVSQKTPSLLKTAVVKKEDLKIDKTAPIITVEPGSLITTAVFTVVDNGGSLLNSVSYQKAAGTATQATAGSDGKYTLTDLAGGTYSITATDNAGNSTTKTLIIAAAKPAEPILPPAATPPPAPPTAPPVLTPPLAPPVTPPAPVLPPEAPPVPTPAPTPLDEKGPVITITRSSLNEPQNAWLLLFEVKDEDSGLDTVSMGDAVQLLRTPSGYAATLSAMGTYQILAKDKAGNENKQTVEVTGFDQTKPLIRLAPQPRTIIWKQTDTLLFTVQENDSGLAEAPSVSFGTTALPVSLTNSGYYSFPVTNNGAYVITATDKAGNLGTSTITVTNIDKIKPPTPKLIDNKKTVPVSTAKSEPYQSDTATMFVSFKTPAKEESAISVMVKFGKEKYKLAPKNKIDLIPGKQSSFLVKLVDAAGNESPEVLYKVDVPETALTIGESK